MSSRVLPVLALALSAHAQETGNWELVPAKGIAPSGLFGHGATTPGYFWTAFNDTAGDSGGFIDVAQYNVIQNMWQNSKDYISSWPQSGYPPQPFGFSFGGFMCLIDELIPSTLYFVSSSPTTSSPTSPNAWQTVPISLTNPAMYRWGQRFLSWGSTVYMFGGIRTQPGTMQAWYNDMYAADLSSLILNNPAQPSQMPGWNLVSPLPPAGSTLVTGFPDPRVGATWTGYTVGAVLFGGVGTTDGSTDVWPTCLTGTPTTPAPSRCFFHSHVWIFFPGSVDWSIPATGTSTATPYTASSWVRMNSQGTNGGPVPIGRTEHVAGSLGDNLYVYGGITAQGPVQANDALWVYHLITQSWSQIQYSQPAPPTGMSYTGAFIANHFYVFVEQYQTPGNGQLWRWAPTFQWSLPVAPSAPAPVSLAGPNAGIVILILIALANAYFLTKIAAGSGVELLPSFLTNCMPSFLVGRSSPPTASSGDFYSQVADTATAPTFSATTNYAPPQPAL